MKGRLFVAAGLISILLTGCGEKCITVKNSYLGEVPEGEDVKCVCALSEELSSMAGHRKLRTAGISGYGTWGFYIDKAREEGGKDYREYMVVEGAVDELSFMERLIGKDGAVYKGLWLMAKEKDGEWEVVHENGEWEQTYTPPSFSRRTLER
ncbi:hypothetical protein [Ruminococcus sp.]|uniref:hypothetical protein n=1 Tax=Ruminococcus sp. TaxID=41978 RepID=UPI0025E2487D|nr:hypothetical protein [Ruminococcus sp.]MBQ8966635.1 hypothetical protein [Ruminococcus sp.]